MYTDLGGKIQAEREFQGLSVKQLAAMSEISGAYLRQLERGIRTPTVPILVKIAKSLRRSISFFISEEYENEREIDQKFYNTITVSGIELRHKQELAKIENMRTKEAITALISRLNVAGFSALKRTFLTDVREIRLDGSIKRDLEIEIEVLGEEVKFYAQKYIQSFDERGTGYNNFKVTLKPLRIEDATMRLKVWRIESNFVYYQVWFTPALRRGKKVRFNLCESYYGAHLMTRDQILDLMKKGQFIETEPVERTGSWITYPTEKLVKIIVFPAGYVPENIFYDVAMNRVQQVDEKRRLDLSDCFRFRRDEKGRWVCQLTVDNPMMGMTYFIKWEPPSKAVYRELLSKEREGVK